MKTWTDYYGSLCEVIVEQDEQGRFTGYLHKPSGSGVSWVRPLEELPADQFWFSYLEAIVGLRGKLLEEHKRLCVILDYCNEHVRDDGFYLQSGLQYPRQVLRILPEIKSGPHRNAHLHYEW